MKAVMAQVPDFVLRWRKTTGADCRDEMWEGVLHLAPMPNRDHQLLEGNLEMWLRMHWARPFGNRVYHQINLASVGGWTSNYRIPDLILLAPDRFHIDRNEYFEGAPTAVVEIRSPDDETMDKLSFYAQLGVPEVWIIDRDTKRPELHVLGGQGYQPAAPDQAGWLHSKATGVELRSAGEGAIELRLAGDESTRALLPED
jgi:Uma2 family endonuclease